MRRHYVVEESIVQAQRALAKRMRTDSETLAVEFPTDRSAFALENMSLPYALEPVAVAKNLEVDPASGLNAAEVAQRRTHFVRDMFFFFW